MSLLLSQVVFTPGHGGRNCHDLRVGEGEWTPVTETLARRRRHFTPIVRDGYPTPLLSSVTDTTRTVSQTPYNSLYEFPVTKILRHGRRHRKEPIYTPYIIVGGIGNKGDVGYTTVTGSCLGM